ncbi:hypothetical protein NG895_11535 [Aeoliella sp. ICT_H6.2]|uniref:Uncharacterized protein n=1 Tax=Aeoliella straminimaris TaxID=2954799 RepID=A0A9X2FAB5_9BACT|nr:hypothetical protein [Aeoliella straminimaris]MCO6044538.1 hypothetical protein [Aeoliella straminimaris]
MHRLSPATNLRWLMLAWLTCAVATTCCLAQSTTSSLVNFHLPSKPGSTSKQSGLSLDVRDDQLGNGQFGYRCLYFEFHSPTPVTADTQITVRASMSDWSRSRGVTTIEADGQLRAGQQKTTLELRFPQSSEWHYIWWQVWIDAGLDKHLSVDRETPNSIGNTDVSRWRNSQMLMFEPELPKSDPESQTDSSDLLSASGINMMATTHQGDLSDNWLDFTPFDFLYCEIDQLVALAQDNPQQMAALRRWVHAGGVLWVRQQSEDWQELHALEPLFGWPSSQGAIEPDRPIGREPAGVDGWSYVNLRMTQTDEAADGLVEDFDPYAQPITQPPAQRPLYSDAGFVVRRHGWGKVAAFDDKRVSDRRQWRFDKLQMAGMYWQMQAWPQRHGLVPGSANTDFSSWLIPGVGLAPVVAFQVLITLFVLGIGPANYWLLKRAGKLQLMVLTVPAVAIAITLGLLSYGVFADGFATRLRAQSITLLDQQTGDATTWSRLSYYAAFAPQDGLTFSDESAVYTIHPGSIEAYDVNVSQSAREIQWTDTEQQLTNGWLGSRTPTQYLVIEPRTTTAGLAVQQSESGITATNQFDSAAQLLVLQDKDGAWWMAESVPAGEAATLTKVDQPLAVTALRDVLRDREPRFPDAYAAAENSAMMYQQRRRMRRSYNQAGMEYAFVSANQSQLQRRWQELLGLSGGQALDIPPGSYVVVGERALLPVSQDEFPVEEASVHIVIGKY